MIDEIRVGMRPLHNAGATVENVLTGSRWRVIAADAKSVLVVNVTDDDRAGSRQKRISMGVFQVCYKKTKPISIERLMREDGDK